MAGKKGGFLGKIGAAIAAEMMEDDGKDETAKVADKASAAAQAAPISSQTQPYPFGTSAAGSTTPPPMLGMPGAPEPLDPKVVEMVSSGVFTDVVDGGKARPSRYMLFSKMWQTLGSPADANIPLNAMKVTDPSMTGGAVLQDIDAHLALLDGVAANANAEIDGVAATKIGGADQKLQAIQQANEAALREIERHQKEISERSAEAATLQGQRAADEASINRAKAKTAAAVESIRAQLQGARNLFASLS